MLHLGVGKILESKEHHHQVVLGAGSVRGNVELPARCTRSGLVVKNTLHLNP